MLIESMHHNIKSNDDLLTQILIRLPILCIRLFTTVSKQWLRILTSLDFICNRSQIQNIDPPTGLFVNHITSSFHCVFVSLDTRIKSRKYTSDNSFTLGYTELVDNVNILQSCNGLLLCTGWEGTRFYYVYNPSTNLVKMFPKTDYTHDDSNFYGCAGLRLAFDLTKLPDYKVVHVGRNSCEIVIQIYSLESGNWTMCRERFTYLFFVHFNSAIYWNDALHWLETENRQLTHYKLNIKDHEHRIITTIQIPQDHEQPIITTMLPMIISVGIHHMLHLEWKLFESIGCLVLVRRDCIGSSRFNIYEMRKGCSVCSSKYIVNTDDFMNLLPEGWSIQSIVWSIVLGEREEDSFLIINLSAKVIQYNLISKTLHEIYDMGSNEIVDDYLHGFHSFLRLCMMWDYKKLDYKIPDILSSRKYISKNSFTLESTEEADEGKDIMHSCNGLLLCTGSRRHAFDYVYNPSTNLLKILPEPDYANVDSNVYGCAGLRLAFDPTKLPYYKVVRVGRTCSDIFIQIYCSEKGNWSLCNERFNYFFFLHFDSAMYWNNNALHWPKITDIAAYALQCKYRIPDSSIITIHIQIPQSLQQGRNFFKSYGNMLPMIITIQIPHILHLEGKLFDSRRCLLLVHRDDFGSNEFTIYEMMKGSYVWSVRYHVDTDDFMTQLPEGWSIRVYYYGSSLFWENGKMISFFGVSTWSGKVVESILISKNYGMY
ncbi:hypothetical protein Tco_0564952 [Tanacetum coccineum]